MCLDQMAKFIKGDDLSVLKSFKNSKENKKKNWKCVFFIETASFWYYLFLEEIYVALLLFEFTFLIHNS